MVCWHKKNDKALSGQMLLKSIYVDVDRSRNLSNPNNMKAVLEELHGATLRNTRATAAFLPTMFQAQQQNPQLGQLKLVVIAWDTRHVKSQHSSSFNFQRRSFSTKIGDNAVVKIAACGLDSKQKFVYLTSASISPSNTDEALCSYLIDMEATQGMFESLSKRVCTKFFFCS